MERITTEQQIDRIIENDGKIFTAQLIMSRTNNEEFGLVIGTRMFSSHYIASIDLMGHICKQLKEKEILTFRFYDEDLTEAWKNSYTYGGISKDDWDRRTVFHPYSEMNEMFCIDDMTFSEITGYDFHGFELRHPIPNWKRWVIGWYKRCII